jgi:hypothetical protein
MTYTINKTDGNEITKIPDGTLDTTSTALTLIGRNAVGFGEALNENLVKLLENFASTTAPENAIKGQIWFDTSSNRLFVYDGNGFRASGGPQVSPRVPDPLTTGDLWINNQTNQMWMFDGTDLVLVGPIYTANQGLTGFKVDTVVDTNGISHSICQIFVKNVLLGIFSSTAFTPVLPIPGYGPAGKVVKVGFNSANLSNLKFDVLVTRSESILTEEGIAKTANELVFTNEENTFTEPTIFQNNDGIEIGASSQIRQYVQGNKFYIENQIQNQSININVKSGAQDPTPGITVTGNGQRVGIFNENPTATLDVLGDLKVSGDIFIGGTTTTLNTAVVEIEDKNIVLGKTLTPSELTADGGGITLKSDVDKTISYNRVSQSWDLSENLKIATGKTFSIGNNEILTSTSIGSSVTSSSLTNLGQLIQLQMDGGLLLQGNTLTAGSGNISLNAPNGAVTVNNRRLVDVASPIEGSDATNKVYVDDAVFRRGISLSLDITNLEIEPGEDDNNAIAEILLDIAPFYDPDGTETEQQGIAVNGTILRLHCTKTSVTNANINYSPTLGNGGFTKLDISSALGQPPGTTTVVADIATGQIIAAPIATVTVTRKNKRFEMENKVWVFKGDRE